MAHTAYTRNSMFLSSLASYPIQFSTHQPPGRFLFLFYFFFVALVVFVRSSSSSPASLIKNVPLMHILLFFACTIYSMFIPSKLHFVIYTYKSICIYICFPFLLFFLWHSLAERLRPITIAACDGSAFSTTFSVLLIVWFSNAILNYPTLNNNME